MENSEGVHNKLRLTSIISLIISILSERALEAFKISEVLRDLEPEKGPEILIQVPSYSTEEQFKLKLSTEELQEKFTFLLFCNYTLMRDRLKVAKEKLNIISSLDKSELTEAVFDNWCSNLRDQFGDAYDQAFGEVFNKVEIRKISVET